jgi:hypothetical protein
MKLLRAFEAPSLSQHACQAITALTYLAGTASPLPSNLINPTVSVESKYENNQRVLKLNNRAVTHESVET